jgi:hypothetical protein
MRLPNATQLGTLLATNNSNDSHRHKHFQISDIQTKIAQASASITAQEASASHAAAQASASTTASSSSICEHKRQRSTSRYACDSVLGNLQGKIQKKTLCEKLSLMHIRQTQTDKTARGCPSLLMERGEQSHPNQQPCPEEAALLQHLLSHRRERACRQLIYRASCRS